MSDIPSPTFGDWEPLDSFDTAPPDPLQVAIKLQALRREADLPRHINRRDWDELDADDRERLVEIMVRFLAWGRRQGWTT